MSYHESHGASLKQLRERKEKEGLHHLRIYAHPNGTADNPAWIIAHHTEADGEPAAEYEVDNSHQLHSHIAQHAHAPLTDEGEEE